MATAEDKPECPRSPMDFWDWDPDMNDVIQSCFIEALDAGIQDPEGKGPTLGHLMAALNIAPERSEQHLPGAIKQKWKAYNEKHPKAALELRRGIAGAITWHKQLYVIDLPEDCPPITEWTKYGAVKIVWEDSTGELKIHFELQIERVMALEHRLSAGHTLDPVRLLRHSYELIAN